MSRLRSQQRAAPFLTAATKQPSAVRAAALALVSLAMLTDAVLAASTQCRQIDSRKERNACYEQQKQQQEAKKKAAPAPMDSAIDQMKLEDDRLAKRLQGICRGC